MRLVHHPGFFFLRAWRFFLCYWDDEMDGKGLQAGLMVRDARSHSLPTRHGGKQL